MGLRVRDASKKFAGLSPSQVLDMNLDFKICTHDLNLAKMHPDKFEVAWSEYAYNVDNLLFGLEPASVNTEMTVVARDNLFLQIIKVLVPRCSISQNQVIPSSAPDRHDFAVAVGGSLGILGVQKVEDEKVAINQLRSSVNVTVLVDALPGGHSSTFAFATTNAVIAVHSLSVKKTSSGNVRPTTDLLRIYNCRVFDERLKFVEDLFKMTAWLDGLHRPNQPGTIIPGKCRL